MRIARLLTVAYVLLVLAGAPAGAMAQSSPFQPLPSAAPAQTTTTAPVRTTTPIDNGNIDTTLAVGIFAVAILLLGGIGFAIYRDAKRRAPVAAGHTAHDEAPATAPHHKKRQARAKGRSAKAARRRNR